MSSLPRWHETISEFQVALVFFMFLRWIESLVVLGGVRPALTVNERAVLFRILHLLLLLISPALSRKKNTGFLHLSDRDFGKKVRLRLESFTIKDYIRGGPKVRRADDNPLLKGEEEPASSKRCT